ncbi:hypothetical protein TIFTF001_012422 [Ficus carica]|uniref:Uncharacterized protein n=1 Tax=Ficus carica TaxID=3494 RepID=A0AA87ZZZ4_FICCA|nr:hypothetical protein TIFTF001_012422 [Ficus carica]
MSIMAAELVDGAVLSASLQYLQFPFAEARSGKSNSNYGDEKCEMIDIFETLEFIMVDLNLVEAAE